MKGHRKKMGRHLKILGLSLLTLVGIMAVSASAAQGEWLLLKNLSIVSSLTLRVQGLVGFISVPELGVQIACSDSEGAIQMTNEGSVLKDSGEVTFTGCVETQFGGACTVMGPGEGEIEAAGAGVAGMDGEGNVIIGLNSGEGEFANIELAGEECPFNELEFPITGTCHLVILEPLTDNAVKLSHLAHLELEFGGSEALIGGEEEIGSILTHLSALNGTDTWQIHLVNL